MSDLPQWWDGTPGGLRAFIRMTAGRGYLTDRQIDAVIQELALVDSDNPKMPALSRLMQVIELARSGALGE